MSGLALGLLVARSALGGYVVVHGVQKATSWLGGSGLAGAAADFSNDGLRGGRPAAAVAALTQVGAGGLSF